MPAASGWAAGVEAAEAAVLDVLAAEAYKWVVEEMSRRQEAAGREMARPNMATQQQAIWKFKFMVLVSDFR